MPHHVVRLLCLVLALGLVLSGSHPASAGVVTTTATAYNTLGFGCLDSHTSTGSTMATATASCDGGGNLGTAFVSAGFWPPASNGLQVFVSSAGPNGSFGPNVYAVGEAYWSMSLVARGGTGGGFLAFDYIGHGTRSGNSAGITCEVRSANITGAQSCLGFSTAIPFTFDTPFDWWTSLYAQTVVPNFGSQTLQTAAINWIFVLQDIRVLDTNFNPIPGAEVDAVPEPATASFLIAGLLLCSALGIGRFRTR